MRLLFYIGMAGLALFEILNVYFIMPMPGSQRMNSIDVAYFLYSWRWVFRSIFILCALAGSFSVLKTEKKWIPLAVAIASLAIVYMFNFRMTADKMFLQPEHVVFKSKTQNELPGSRLVIGVHNNDEAKAYPISFIAYHHQVQDTIGGKPVIVTYCNVCRTGRVFEPLVDGKPEKFRLVGMDHFNAMFEDATTKSWWRQVNGEAIVGKLKGKILPEVECEQMTIEKWYQLYPNGLVMQADQTFAETYDSLVKFERGKSESHLTRTDSVSWKDKSWVIGIELDGIEKAYDWNDLKKQRLISDVIGNKNILIVLSSDSSSFAAFENPDEKKFEINNEDHLVSDSLVYDFSGKGLSSDRSLKKVQAHQEFWHSWRTFHPNTQKYSDD